MPEDASAADILSTDGGGGDAGAGGDAGGDGGGVGGGGGGAELSWVTGLNEDHTSYLTGKGFKTADDLVRSYREMESFRGVPQERLLQLPEDMSSSEAMESVFVKLGRPATAEAYDLPDLDGDSSLKLMPAYREFALKAGISQSHAKATAEFFQEHVSKAMEGLGNEDAEAMALKEVADLAALKTKWGAGYDEGIATSKRAVTAFGVEGVDIQAISDAIGVEKTFTLFRKIGAAIGEHRTTDPSAEGGQYFQGSPDWAKNEIQKLKEDVEFRTRYVNGDAGAKRKMNELHRAAYPQEA